MIPSMVATVGLAVLLLLPFGRAWASPFILDLQPPITDAGGPYVVTKGQSLTLDGSASTEPDPVFGQFIISYMWDINVDGLPDAVSITPTLKLPAAFVNLLSLGFRPLALTVTDSFGLHSTAFTTLTVAAAATTVPEPTATVLLLIALAGVAGVWRLRQWGGEASVAPRV